MHRRMLTGVPGAAFLVLWCLPPLGGSASQPATVAARPAFTAQEQESFDGLYKSRIDKARSRAERLALAKELLAGAEKLEGGLKYLALTAGRDLAADGGGLDLAIQAQEQLIALKGDDAQAMLRELLDLQLKHFNILQRQPVSPKDRSEHKKRVFALGARIVDNAIALGNACRAALDFAAAEEVENQALPTARLISSPQTAQLRQGIAISRAMRSAAAKAQQHEAAGRADLAIWEYLDAGMYQRAAKLKSDSRDETADLLVTVALDPNAKPQAVLDAAKAWDNRAAGAGEGLEAIRLARAAEMYQRCLSGSDETTRKMVQVRLQAIQAKLGDLLMALRPPGEWACLVDLKEDSAQVGHGSFEKFTVAKGPVAIAGKEFDTGMMVHAPSRVVYSLGGRYRQLSIYYGMASWAGGAASFQILCDGKTVFESPGTWKQHNQGVQQPLIISLVGVDKLELVTKAVAIAGAHSMWGDPKVR